MGELLGLVVVIAVVWVVVRIATKRSAVAAAERTERELVPVRKLADEDVTALGEELTELDLAMAGRELDAGERADYQRALDAYESAKAAVNELKKPDDVRHVTEILEDGRYAMACVQARVAGEPLPTRRQPCFFDPRHGLSVADVAYAPPGGAERDVPACSLDAERVRAGAEPDIRQVQVGAQRMPYWQGGPAYAPYAAGYYGSGMMPGLFMGMMLTGGMGMLGEGLGAIGDGVGDVAGGIGDGLGDIGGGIGDMFDF